MLKKVLLCLLVAWSLLVSGFAFADAPHEIAGFAVGGNIADYQDRLQMDTALPVRHMESIYQVEVRPPDGFKSGLITYGNCLDSGRILKVSMKYASSRKDFFDRLLARLKEKFGGPAEWRGDPFHVYEAWKWSFTDKENNRISMILQHYPYDADDDEYKKGNSIKLSMPGLIEKEQQCWERKHPGAAGEGETGPEAVVPDDADFDRFIPK